MRQNDKILLVEDDKNLGFVIKDNLESNGFSVDLALNGKQGWELFSDNKYHLALLDVMLPEQDGFSLARNIRKVNDEIPLIFLTARSMEEDKLTGFKIGADDYITKPFNMEELVFRIRVFLRRTKNLPIALQNRGKYICHKIGQYTFNPDQLLLIRKSGKKKLTQREAILLDLFCKNRNRVLKRTDILQSIWGSDDYFLGRSLDVFISRLRKYLKDDPKLQIINHHGVGFEFMDLHDHHES